jgi:tetratricopeptide (TPR) repeat protein
MFQKPAKSRAVFHCSASVQKYATRIQPVPVPLMSTSAPHLASLLGASQSDRAVLQDFTPLAASLEWELSGRYFSRRGSLAFLTAHIPVPYTVNNHGTPSRQAAEVFFAALTSGEIVSHGEIVILELGIGLGLFARYFLDAFRDLCTQRGADYYDRLTYVAADYSERMLLDAVRRGTFQNHPGRYALRVIDALDPQAALRRDPLLRAAGNRPLSAVCLNYLLDCLPVTVLRADADPTKGEPTPATSDSPPLRRLCVRACLARGVNLREYTEYTPADLAQLVKSDNPGHREELLNLFGLFTSEYDYQPVDVDELPHPTLAREIVVGKSGPVVHSHGAIACLEKLLNLLQPNGIILVNDYGSVETTDTGDHFEHQRYGGSSFVGVNFNLLKRHFANRPHPPDGASHTPVTWAEPEKDSPRIFSRLLGHDLHPDVVATFRRCFDGTTAAELERPAQAAQTLAGQGRYEAAATAYRIALERTPWDWLVILEAANFLTFGLKDSRAGAELARAGLELNPCCSPELWNAYGDALFSLGQIDRSRDAYERALAVNVDDVQARYNLAWVFLHKKEHSEALRVIAEALARDWRGTFRDRLFQKQAEVLADLGRRTQQEMQTLMNRVSLYPRSPDDRDTESKPRPNWSDKGGPVKPT